MRTIFVIFAIMGLGFAQNSFAQATDAKGTSYWYVMAEQISTGYTIVLRVVCTRADARIWVEKYRDNPLDIRGIHAIPEPAFERQYAAGLIYVPEPPLKPRCP